MDIRVLEKVAKVLNDVGCEWAIGSSMVLNSYGLVDKPNDIDVLFDPKYASKVKMHMNKIGTIVNLPSKEPFRTEEFFGYIVDDTEVEFMGGFKIDLGNNQEYRFILDEKAIVNVKYINGIKINYTSLEDWFVAYSVMKDPKKRVSLIRGYFLENSIDHMELLERNLEQDLPQSIKNGIYDIKSKCK